MIDVNHDGKVTLYGLYSYSLHNRDEFVNKYLETRSRLSDKLNEVFKKIADHKRQRDDMAMKLKQVQVLLIDLNVIREPNN
jgi:hypothetical protein